jgi:selenocysteine-specific elongation factor
MLRETSEPLTVPELRRQCFLRPEEMAAVLERLRTEGRLVELPGGVLAHSRTVQETGSKLVEAVRAFHAANPQRAGLGRDELFALVGGSSVICEQAVESLVKAKQLERQGAVIAQAGWSARLTDPDTRLCEQIGTAFQKAGWAGPSVVELAASLNQPPARIEKMMRLLTERAVLVCLDPQTCIHRDALEAAKQVALRLFAQKPSFSTMDFRDALGVSRKYAVPLVDYLDKLRFTVRMGNNRTPGVEARKLMKG